ncbi:MAG TPA: hypothetical protein VFK05_06910 [Polyangiaceae bacterium]|nr:hypothetical protein [Polyangiaceae bacterium]
MKRVSLGVGILALSLFTALACDEGSGGGGDKPPATPPVALTLPAGSRYFETADGRRAPVMMRNVTAGSAGEFAPLFAAAHENGTIVVRLQLTQGFGYATLGMDNQGHVLPAFASSWDQVIESAAQHGLDVIPVFAIWGDWNNGTPALGWTHFDANPLNQANGGPAATPAELFADTPTQTAWLGWVETLVKRWRGHSNIVAWETFSELDLATGASEANAAALAARVANVVRAADLAARPVFASTSDLPLLGGAPWLQLWNGPGCDFAALHVYDPNLDQAAIERTHAALSATAKPVMLGESGLDAAEPRAGTLTTSDAAPRGLESAIWAELVSGSATARALYWEDGYAAYYPESGLALVNARANLERKAADWLQRQDDFRGLTPLLLDAQPTMFGTALGDDQRVLGWARDAAYSAASWNSAPLASATIRVALPAGARDGAWTVTVTFSDGSETPSAGTTSGGTLSFSVSARPFNQLAFAARRTNSP